MIRRQIYHKLIIASRIRSLSRHLCQAKVRQVKVPAAVKPAKSAYLFYSCQHQNDEEVKEKSMTDKAKHVGGLWKAATDEEKAPFQEQAKQDVARFLAECVERGLDPKTAGKKTFVYAEKKPKASKKAKVDSSSNSSSASSNTSVAESENDDVDSEKTTEPEAAASDEEDE